MNTQIERLVASSLFITGVWGTSNTLSGTNQWSDFANSDPVTGQAAWYDLRVKVERIGPADARSSAPTFATLDRLPEIGRAHV